MGAFSKVVFLSSLKKMSGKVRKERLKTLIRIFGYTCPFCNVDMIPKSPTVSRLYNDTRTIDHIVPLSKGGKNSLDNLTLCCFKCNGEKADKLPSDEFLKIVETIRKRAG